MPAVSQAQRSFLYATKGAAWVRRHHFNNKGRLPAHVRRTRAKRQRQRAAVRARYRRRR